MELRDYQVEAVKSMYDYYAQGNQGNPLVVLPTAAGKSVVMAEFIKSACVASPTQRMMVVTDTKELIQQNFEKLCALWPSASAGIFSNGLGRRDTQQRVIFAGIQSIHNKAYMFGKRDVILFDECQGIDHTLKGRYGRFISSAQEVNSKVKCIGFTATPFRMKGGHLLNGELFTDIAYELQIKHLIDKGYLTNVRTKAPEGEQVDMQGVRLVGRDYNKREMQQRYMKDGVTIKAIEDVFERITTQKSFLFFCAGKEHAKMVHDILRTRGLRGECICDDTPSHIRDQGIAKLRNGDFDYLTNNAVLTTGTDIPRVDCVVLLRSTKSRGLYIQIVGRGMRLHNDKEYCLLLDYGGNVERFGCIDEQPEGRAAIDSKSGNEEQDAPFIRCNKENIVAGEPCGEISHAKATHCEWCGAEFKQKEKHSAVASGGFVITPEKKEKPIETVNVTSVRFMPWISKNSGKETLCIEYITNMVTKKPIREWKTLKTAYYTMQPWFNGVRPSCLSISELVDYCKEHAAAPTSITIRQSKYIEVIGHDFTR